MGTAMRFVAGLAGVLFICFGIGIIAPSMYELLADPYGIDMPGGALLVGAMLLLAGSAPILGGVFLLRKALRSGDRVAPASVPAASAVIETETVPLDVRPPIESASEVPVEPAAPPASPPAGAMHPVVARPRRRWLAVVGLCLASLALLVEAVLVAFAISTARHDAGEAFAIAFFLFVGGFLVALGFWIAHVGDPGIGARFVRDIAGNLGTLRSPGAIAALLRTSGGLALATAVVAVPLMIVSRAGSGVVGMMAVTMFSVVDPLLNLFRRSWWWGAFVSAGTWFLLFVAFGAVANAMQPMGEGAMIFLLPMMVYPAALALSGVVRLVKWASTAGLNPQSR